MVMEQVYGEMECEEIFDTYYIKLGDRMVIILGPAPRKLS